MKKVSLALIALVICSCNSSRIYINDSKGKEFDYALIIDSNNYYIFSEVNPYSGISFGTFKENTQSIDLNSIKNDSISLDLSYSNMPNRVDSIYIYYKCTDLRFVTVFVDDSITYEVGDYIDSSYFPIKFTKAEQNHSLSFKTLVGHTHKYFLPARINNIGYCTNLKFSESFENLQISSIKKIRNKIVFYDFKKNEIIILRLVKRNKSKYLKYYTNRYIKFIK